MKRLGLTTVLMRGLRLRCPRCGDGRLYAGFMRMNPTCSVCALKYERAPGFFLGSAYINYAATALLLFGAYMPLHFVLGFTNRQLVIPLCTFIVTFPLVFFHWARSLWLAMDCYLDISDIQSE